MRLSLIIFVAIVFVTCTNTEETIAPRQYPLVRTLQVDNITNQGVELQGEIFSLGNAPIIDHGFIFSPDDSFDNYQKVSLGSIATLGKYIATLDYGLYKDKKYFVKFFTQTDNHIAYGESVSFMSLGSKGPVILDIVPKIATWGDTVTITGTRFFKSLQIDIGNIKGAKIVSLSEDTIKALVPQNLQNEISDVSMSFDGMITRLPAVFRLIPPTIDNIEPQEGTLNSLVEIRGKYFNSFTTKVFFEAIQVEQPEIGSNLIRFRVPMSLAKGGENSIKVQTGDGALSSQASFIVMNPVISKINPVKAAIKEVITIEGMYFGPDKQSTIVRFDGLPGVIISGSQNKIEVVVPEFVKSTKPKINVEYKQLKSESTVPFELYAPEITEVVPQTLTFNSTFTIKGKYFNTNWIKEVRIGDRSTSFIVNNLTSMTVTSPRYVYSHESALKIIWKDGDEFKEALASQPVYSTWSRLNDVPLKIYRPAALMFNGKAYVGLGVNAVDTKIREYDAVTDKWNEFTQFPGGNRQWVISFVVNSKAYFGNGYNETSNEELEDFWSFDFISKQWTRLSDKTFSNVPFSFSIDNVGYVIESISNINQSKLWRYNHLSDTWEVLSDMGFRCARASGFEIEGQYYVIDDNKDLRRYDPGSNQWTYLGFTPSKFTSEEYSYIFVLNNQAYMGGTYGNLWKFVTESNQWINLGYNMVSIPWGSIGFSLNGKGYAVNESSFEYDPNY